MSDTCAVCKETTNEAVWYAAFNQWLGQNTIYNVCPKCNQDPESAMLSVRAIAAPDYYSDEVAQAKGETMASESKKQHQCVASESTAANWNKRVCLLSRHGWRVMPETYRVIATSTLYSVVYHFTAFFEHEDGVTSP